jgi:hypothetical protein
MERKAQTFSKIIDDLINNKKEKDMENEISAAEKRRRERQPIIEVPKQTFTPNSNDEQENFDTLSNVLISSMNKKIGPSSHLKLKRDKFGRLQLKNSLAQLLYDAFRLKEEMDNFMDRQILENHLHGKLPVHPRRTLDQAYYHSLKNTSARDRDQVIYRATAHQQDMFHQWEFDENGKDVRWKCYEEPDKPDRSVEIDSIPARIQKRCPECGSTKTHKMSWRGNCPCPESPEFTTDEDDDENKAKIAAGSKKKRGGCEYCGSTVLWHNCRYKNMCPPDKKEKPLLPCQRCFDEIRKRARLVMVDQLWMWILDEHTILTFFPGRYGVNRQDASGIHKSIRNRVEKSSDSQIKSIFDLALIILSECTKTIFDRTRTLDRRPRVLDMFLETIGQVVNSFFASKRTPMMNILAYIKAQAHKETIAFNKVWESAEKLRRAIAAPGAAAISEISTLHVQLLNIAPEALLQREIRDVLDELGIMIHLVKEQKSVLDMFCKNAQRILEKGASESKLLDRFKISIEDLLAETDSRLRELEILNESATTTSEGVSMAFSTSILSLLTARQLDYLLTLKQQQAAVIQTWESIQQGQEAVHQGQSIMIFTTMTIIFVGLLPSVVPKHQLISSASVCIHRSHLWYE